MSKASSRPDVGSASPPAPTGPASTVAAAGEHNSYIWTKADYFFNPAAATLNSASAAAGGAASPSSPRSPASPLSPSDDPVAVGGVFVPGTALRFYVRGLAVGVFMLSVSLVVTNFFMLPLMLAAFGWVVLGVSGGSSSGGGGGGKLRRWSRLSLHLCDWSVALWQGMVSALLERCLGMGVVLAGDLIPASQVGEGALMLSNHPSTADWTYLWSFLFRQCGGVGALAKMKIVLKGSMHSLPIIGWALQCCRYLFLARNWEQDRLHIDEVVRHWSREGSVTQELTQGGGETTTPRTVQLLMFPEGTDLRPVSYDQSAAFVAKSVAAGGALQLKPLQHLLQPRVTGFVHVVKLMRQTGVASAVYDLTLASVPVPVTIENLARGVVPDEIHIHARRYDLSSLPTSDDELAAWLHARWAEKDALLESFYSCPDQRRFPMTPEEAKKHEQSARDSARPLLLQHASLLALWSLVFFAHGLMWLRSPLLMTLAHAICIAIWHVVTSRYGGFDTLLRKIDRKYDEEERAAATTNKPTGGGGSKKLR